jgi:hypothetical protein
LSRRGLPPERRQASFCLPAGAPGETEGETATSEVSPVSLRPLEPMLRPLGLAILLVTAFVLWVPNPEAHHPSPPPSCEELAGRFRARFYPAAQGRFRPLESATMAVTIPRHCWEAWAYDPGRSWDLARLDRRPRPREGPYQWPERGRIPVVAPT